MAASQLRGLCRGLGVVVPMTLSAVVGSVLVLLPSAMVMRALPLPPVVAAHRRVADFVAATWFAFSAALLETIGGAQLTTSGLPTSSPPFAEDKVSVVLLNHHCRIDWLFLWGLAVRGGAAGGLKIVLKDSLRSVPFFGWATQAFLFPFLSRKDRTKDLAAVRDRIRHALRVSTSPLVVAIFPEGTDLSPTNRDKSLAFARARGLAEWQTVLVPRAGGLAQALRASGGRLGAVYDMTISYGGVHAQEVGTGDARPSEFSLLYGRLPRRVHVHVARWSADALPPGLSDDEPACLRWLLRQWAEKERRLSDGATALPAEHSSEPMAGGTRALVAGFALCSMFLLLVWTSWVFRTCTLAGCALIYGLTAMGGGLDDWEMAVAATMR